MLCNDGTSIPQLGLGVFQMSEAEAEAAVVTARQAGYRLVDSAAGYENEGAVGRAIARFDRDDFYVTTKLKNDDHGYDETLAAFDSSMAKLGIDTLDLYLIHWPSPGRDRYVDSWRALIRLRDEGRVTSIGVSNFEPHHLRRIIDE
ncbi:MAG: aldo/keto reductase, partial [Acidimicrobiia bacterium]|nr:aldo/keto reductase [Acidimicrobiia bacterium]